MYITNNCGLAAVAQNAGVDRIFLDLEELGKNERQFGMNTVQSHHTIDDVRAVRKVINKSELLVRCNSIINSDKAGATFEDEIDMIVDCKPDIIMLPYFTTVAEAERFIRAVDGRAKTVLLIETTQAVESIDDIIKIGNIDEMYIGLNDLSIGYKMNFMFEPILTGVVDKLAEKFILNKIPFGFGGIAAIGKGKLPAEYIIKEHYRVGSTISILSRSFYNPDSTDDIAVAEKVFNSGIAEIREYEEKCIKEPQTYDENHKRVLELIKSISAEIKR